MTTTAEQTAHTPGRNWSYEQDARPDGTPVHGWTITNEAVDEDSPGHFVAYVHSTQDDARLATAAPDMLAALKGIVTANDAFRASLPHDWESDLVDEACKIAKAIIARAESR